MDFENFLDFFGTKRRSKNGYFGDHWICTHRKGTKAPKVNRGTKRTYHEVNEEFSASGDGEEFCHNSSPLFQCPCVIYNSHIQLVADPDVFFNVRSNSHINSVANREIR